MKLLESITFSIFENGYLLTFSKIEQVIFSKKVKLNKWVRYNFSLLFGNICRISLPRDFSQDKLILGLLHKDIMKYVNIIKHASPRIKNGSQSSQKIDFKSRIVFADLRNLTNLKVKKGSLTELGNLNTYLISNRNIRRINEPSY